jgi:hypothetical protein
VEVLNILAAAVGPVQSSLLSGSAPLVDTDFIIQENPLVFSGLYYKNKDTYIFVITEEGFESGLLTE